MTEPVKQLPCIVCGAELKSAFPPEYTTDNQPYAGTAFTTGGHYGSTVFHSMGGSRLEINVCDPCLKKNVSRVGYRTYLPPKRQHVSLKPWNGEGE